MATAPTPDEEGIGEDDDIAPAPAIADLGTGEAWHDLLPRGLLDRYEVQNYRRAAEILSTSFPDQFAELCQVLMGIQIPVEWVRAAGGNESPIPKRFSEMLRPLGWRETQIKADLHVKRFVVERSADTITSGPRAGQQRIKNGQPAFKNVSREIEQEPIRGYVDGHKIDYVKDGVAFDLEWNSKDQTFDRDLFAMRTFFDCQAIEVGVIVTRSADLKVVFDTLPQDVRRKYGASSTWLGKLLYRLKSGRSGGCPVLAFGIKSPVITGWQPATNAPPGQP